MSKNLGDSLWRCGNHLGERNARSLVLGLRGWWGAA